MHHPTLARVLGCGLLGIWLGVVAPAESNAQTSIQLTKIGSYDHDGFAVGASEIVAHDPTSQQLFVVNAQDARIDILSVTDPTNPTLVGSIDVSTWGAVANSVAVSDGVVAVAIENANKQANGTVAFFDNDGTYLSSVTVGALPDMVTYTPNGDYVLVANEGEPSGDYTSDPVGSVSIIDVRAGVASLTQSKVRTIDFSSFNNATLDPSIRVYGPGASVAQDMEPEYIAVSHNSKTAYVTLQENNAIAVIDIKTGTIERLTGLGFKDHSLTANALDPSDRDNAIAIANWPLLGMYQPDAIAAVHNSGSTFLVMANEGDARDYPAFSEVVRVGSLALDPTVFPNGATLKANSRLGRLRVTNRLGDIDNDGDFDRLHPHGARSFSIRDASGALVYDSGDDLEQITAAAYPTGFNSDNEANNSFDTRSDDKGPEPEGIAVGKVHGNTYAFVGLERIGGIAVFDIGTPSNPSFVQYINTRDFSGNAAAGTAGDLGPEGVLFVSEDDSPIANALLVVGNEISGTTAIFEIEPYSLEKGALGATASKHIGMSAVYPNPASERATIVYSLADDATVSLTLVDGRGSTIASIVDGRVAAGAHEASIDTRALASGRYYCVMKVDGEVREVRPVEVGR